MDKLHKTIWRLEFLLAIILFLIAIAGILDAGIPKRIILNVNIEVIGVSLIVSYLVFFYRFIDSEKYILVQIQKTK